ncbi:unnamed protein product [Spodoptera littoralis]|uniref:Uncharacterized protein n=1 Tax=Spodoptera littoralis TaxID=7109 RepID=A0A9P0HZX6_SPOLI|nr:unnamed protein product [Spodoptera littoralis]CAH1636942.1 unnamed protein product [Spodoptera littoralis]
MAKVTCIVLFLVGVGLSSIQADDGKNRSEVENDLNHIIEDCIKEHHIPRILFSAAAGTGSTHALPPCFWSCCFKGVGVLNSDDQYDIDTTLDFSKKLFGDEDYEKVEEIVKKCESVNGASVSNGNIECEKSVLLADCLFDNAKKHFPNTFSDI